MTVYRLPLPNIHKLPDRMSSVRITDAHHELLTLVRYKLNQKKAWIWHRAMTGPMYLTPFTFDGDVFWWNLQEYRIWETVKDFTLLHDVAVDTCARRLMEAKFRPARKDIRNAIFWRVDNA